MTNSEIKKLYNVVKIVSAKDLVNLSKSYKDNLETIIVIMEKKKGRNSQMPAWFVQWNKNVFSKVLTKLEEHDKLFKQQAQINKKLLKALNVIDTRLDRIVKLNNLKE